MKKEIIFLLAFCIQFLSLQAQITFEKNYHALVKEEAIQSVDEDGNGGYYAAVGTQRETQDSIDTLGLMHLNAYGDTLWQTKFLINHYPQIKELKKDINAIYLMGISEDTIFSSYKMLWLAKFDLGGSLIWKKFYQDINLVSRDDLNGLTLLPNGNIIITTTYVGFLELDSSGTIQKKLRYGPYYSTPFMDFQKGKIFIKNGTFRIATFYTSAPSTFPIVGQFKLFKVDLNADSIGSYPIQLDTISLSVRLVKSDMTGDKVIGRYGTPRIKWCMRQLDTSGIAIWTKKIEGKTYANSHLSSSTVLLNGNIVLSGFQYNQTTNLPPQGKAFLYCFNDSGDSLWYKEFRADSLHKAEFYDVLATSDSGMIACGQILMPDGSRQGYLVKLDENGNLFNPLSVVEKQQQSYLHLYPNPAQDYTRFHYMGKEAQAILRISDLQGREVYHQPISGKEFRFTLNTSDFASGYYFCSIISDGHAMLTKKLVVIR